MSQTVFRYVFLGSPKRPAASVRLLLPSVSIGSVLISLADAEDARARMREFARTFMSGPQFLRSPADLGGFRQYQQFLHAVASRNRLEASSLANAIRNIFGAPAEELVASPVFQSDLQRLGDAIVVLTLLSSVENPDLLSEHVRLYRALDLISKVALPDPTIDGLRRRVWDSTPLQLPAELLPIPGHSAGPSLNGGDSQQPDDGPSMETITAKLALLEQAADDLLSLRAADLRVVENEAQTDETANALLPVRARLGALERAVSGLISASGSGDAEDIMAGASALLPATFADTGTRPRLVASSDAIRRLAAPTRSILEELEFDLDGLSVAAAVERLERESARLGAELALAAPELPAAAIIRVGRTAIPSTLLNAGLPSAAATPGSPATLVPPGTLKMCSVGSLLLTAMHVLRYEPGEVAHIENVLIGEEKERETRRLRRTEETLIREIETTKEEERDLQTTERLEMQREAQNTVRESQDLTVGSTISAGYGPFVQATFNTQYATQSSSEDTARNAASYSREITERTASKISERVREEQTIRVIQEFEERNRHVLSGAGRDEHIIGLFQWIDKVYHAQVFDYGVRLICEIVVPEPAYFLQRAIFMAQLQQKNALVPPDPIDFGPETLTWAKVGMYAKKYGVKGLQPPPEPVLTLSATFESEQKGVAAEGDGAAASPGSETKFTSTREVKIPTGYRAVEAWAAAPSVDALPNKGGVPYGVLLMIGRRVFPFISPDDGSGIKGTLTASLDDEVDSIPIVVLAENVANYVASVEITCYRTSTAVRRWQLQTYQAILEAYQALDAEYRERVAELAAQQGITFGGRNPAENRRIERTELKRLALSIIAKDHFSGYGAYLSTAPVPHVDFDKAEEQGQSINFFERAFEWEHIVYEFYSYFWTSKNRWAGKLLAEDTDPIHKAFHDAGAARVLLPVRPDYEQLFFHFMNTGQIWKGADLPPIASPFQTALLAAIMERRSVEDPHQRIPVGEPWEVRLPTTLVRVSPTGTLPRWEVGEEGQFTLVEPA